MTSPKEWGVAQKFLDAKPNSVWDQIFNNHMTDKSFTKGENDAINTMMKKKELLAAYFSIEAMNYYSKPCQLKVAWKSSEKLQISFAFPKNSPLVPFFKYAYGKSNNLEPCTESMKNGNKLDNLQIVTQKIPCHKYPSIR